MKDQERKYNTRGEKNMKKAELAGATPLPGSSTQAQGQAKTPSCAEALLRRTLSAKMEMVTSHQVGLG